MQHEPVLIIGAGIAGLVLAQALRKERNPLLSVPFIIFERDLAVNSRLQGWALTIHFALPDLLSLLPQDIIELLDSTLVDPENSYDRSPSVFINLANCEYKWKLPPGSGTRKRVSRDRFRKLLFMGIESQVRWGKSFTGFRLGSHGDVEAFFDDGSKYRGVFLVGVDGAASRVRSLLYDLESCPMTPLPLYFLGTSFYVSEPKVLPLLEIDSTLFQGCHPESSTWMWFSVMESPRITGTNTLSHDQRIWKVQLCLSWPTLPGSDAKIPESDVGRICMMREKAGNFHPKLRRFFEEALPSNHGPILSLKLVDWCLPTNRALVTEGRVTLAGDAAHTMAMYRGEGFNQSIVDIRKLVTCIETMFQPAVCAKDFSEVRKQTIASYEMEVRSRGEKATRLCRQACLDVHDWYHLDENSAVREKWE